MKHLHTAFLIGIFVLLSGMNCQNRAIDKPAPEIPKGGATWNEIHANSDAIDSALNAAFADLKAAKRKPTAKVIELVTPSGPNTFIKQNYNE